MLAIYLIYSGLSAQNRFEDKENVCYFAHVTTIPVVDCRESRLRTFYDGLGEASSVRSSSNAVSFRTDFIITFGSTMIWTPPQRRKSGKEYLFGTWKLTHEAWFEFWAGKILLYLGRSERIVSISASSLCICVLYAESGLPRTVTCQFLPAYKIVSTLQSACSNSQCLGYSRHLDLHS
jgi:hypothetical protein